MKEILSKKQESLRILWLHCQEKESEAQRKHTMLQEYKEQIFVLNLQIEEEKSRQRQLRLNFEEQLEDLMTSTRTCGNPIGQRDWQERSAPWTAARSSFSRERS